MAPRKTRSAGDAEEPRSRPLRKKLDPRLDILLGLGKKVALRVREQEHERLNVCTVNLREASRKLLKELEHVSDPKERRKLTDERLGPLRQRFFPPLTAGICLSAGQRDPLLSVFVRSKLTDGELRKLGVRVRSRAGDSCTALVKWSTLAGGGLDASDGIESIELARGNGPHAAPPVDYAELPAMHAAGYKGAGVIIGVADRYIDFHHPAFVDSSAPVPRSRIRHLWCQGDIQVISPDSPAVNSTGTTLAPLLAGFTDGSEYTQAEIDTALGNAGDPYDPVDHQLPSEPDETDMHGTQVAGTALGNVPGGTPPFVGAAPEAELIFVHLRDAKQAGMAQATAITSGFALIDSTALFEACSYIFERASDLGRPCVVCLSYGDPLGPHDGSSLFEQALTELLAAPERVLVVSAGNEGHMQTHARGAAIPAGVGGVVSLDIVVATGAHNIEELQVWFDGADDVSAKLTCTDSGGNVSQIAGGVQSGSSVAGSSAAIARAEIQVRGAGANGRSSVTLVLFPDSTTGVIARGTYTLELTVVTYVSGSCHAWTSRSNPGTRFLRPTLAGPSVTTPGTADGVITVGAHQLAAPPPEIRFDSGVGPACNNTPKPDLCAGSGFLAPAYGGNDVPGTVPPHTYTTFGGTSSAAPIVAGAAAVLIEMLVKSGANSAPGSATVLAELVHRSSQSIGPVGTAFDPNVWGAGWLKLAAVPIPAAAVQAPAAATMPMPPSPLPPAVPDWIPALASTRHLPRVIPLDLEPSTSDTGLEVRALGPAEEVAALEVDIPLKLLDGNPSGGRTRRSYGVQALLDLGMVGAAGARVVDASLRVRARGAWLRIPQLGHSAGTRRALTVRIRGRPGSGRTPQVRTLQYVGGRTIRVDVH